MQPWKLGFVLLSLLTQEALAQIETDGTLGRQTKLVGRDIEISEKLGTRAGNNLFHSLKKLDVEAAGSVTFTGNGSIDAVIARVTGDTRSRIEGRLGVDIPGASFWLFNPQGVFIGPGGSIQVDGNIHISTGKYLEFSDRNRFSADIAAPFRLSVAEPDSFGFFGAGKLEIKNTNLDFGNGRLAGLSAGEIVVDNSDLVWRDGSLDAATDGGVIRLVNGSSLEAKGPKGSLSITTGMVSVDSSDIRAVNDLDSPSVGSGIIVQAETIDMRNGAKILSETTSQGRAPNVVLSGESIELSNSTQIASNSRGIGEASDIEISANHLSIETGSFVSSEAFASGRAGNVAITSGNLELRGDSSGAFTGIASQAAAGSTGDAGDIDIEADRVSVSFGAQISSDTFAEGDGGRVEIAAKSIALIGDGAPVLTAISGQSNPGSAGRAGSVRLKTDKLSLIDGGLVTANTLSDGVGGSVRIEAGKILIDNVANRAFTGISSNTALGLGDAGDVVVSAESLDVRGTGIVSSITFGAGDGGMVSVQANSVELDGRGVAGFSGITSQANVGSIGNAGDVRIKAGRLKIANGSTINSSTFGVGDAGRVDVDAGSLRVVAGGSGLATGIVSDAQAGSGNAGRVSVRSRQIDISQGGQISSRTLTSGDAGAIGVRSDELKLSCRECGQFTGITSRTSAVGDAGSITVVSNKVEIDGASIESSTSAAGEAGSVTLIASSLDMRKLATVGSRSTGGGNAGNIVIATEFATIEGSDVETSGTGSEGGRIDLKAGGIVRLQDATMTSTGIRPATDASLINIEAQKIALNRSRVESLFTSVPVTPTTVAANSGQANLRGKVTIISVDSSVAAGTSIDVTGLDNGIGSDLVGNNVEFAKMDIELAPPCAVAFSERASSFIYRRDSLQRRPGPSEALNYCAK